MNNIRQSIKTKSPWKNSKDILLIILGIVFILFVIFYPSSPKKQNNNVSQSLEAIVSSVTPSPSPVVQEKLDKEKIEADFNKKYNDYLAQQKIPLDIKNKSWQVIDAIEVEHQNPYYSYKIGTAEFRIYKRNEPDEFGSYDWRDRLEVFNKGERLGDPSASPVDFYVISRITALRHNGDRYIFLQNWTGGAHCCQDEYVFRLDKDDSLRAIEILSLLDGELSSENIIQKNGYLYLKLMDLRFRYFHTSFAGSPVFYQYLIINGDQFIIRNGDFKEEYIKQAKIDQGELDKYLKNTKIEEMQFPDWSPFLVQQTVNYLMAGESEKAWSEFDSYFQKFSAISSSSLKDFDNYLTGYSGENNVLLDRFKLEIKQLMAERDF